jgi:IS30 family transposase
MAQGMTNVAACRKIGVNRKTGTRWSNGRTVVTSTGRVRTYPSITRPPRRSAVGERFLSEEERLAIADGVLAGDGIRAIARELGRSPSTISRELANNADPATGRYRPHQAQLRSEAQRARPKPDKFVLNPELAGFVQGCLHKHWSPEQISKALPQVFPDRPDMRTCHETIYQALYEPGRGGLKREGLSALRTGRSRRKRRRRPDERLSRFGGGLTLIAERPVEVADRGVPGHWEGDLIMGKGNLSAIGTLVERTTRYVDLVHLPAGHNGQEMKRALAQRISMMPAHLMRSITWDQGGEMGRHHELTAETGVAVYFCDAGSPWQRGTNENTNGLLRQYFPKGTDLRAYGPDDLEGVARELNSRPRKILGWDNPAASLQRLVSSTF